MGEQPLRVRRTSWHTDDLALLCGIANAGGGCLVVEPNERSRARGVRKMHRVFEELPTLTLQAFGFSCTTEPIMDGAQLCLEITVPAATEPLAFRGSCYLYADGRLKRLTAEEAAVLLPLSAPTRAADDASAQKTTPPGGGRRNQETARLHRDVLHLNALRSRIAPSPRPAGCISPAPMSTC